MASVVRYVHAIPQQEPYDFGLDQNGRKRYAFNVVVMRHPTFTESSVVVGDEVTKVKTFTGVLHMFIEELVTILQNAGVGTKNTNIFITSISQIPAKGGPYLSIAESAGLQRLATHDLDYSQPAAQLVARSPHPGDARLMAWNAYNALNSARNVDVTTS